MSDKNIKRNVKLYAIATPANSHPAIYTNNTRNPYYKTSVTITDIVHKYPFPKLLKSLCSQSNSPNNNTLGIP